jgi:hypothetical protein
MQGARLGTIMRDPDRPPSFLHAFHTGTEVEP